jgi:uncharacterized protein (TIGR03083 family)
MEISEYIAALVREGDLLATTAAGLDLDTAIPTCPGWRMRDLVHHIGEVHRWAAANLTAADGHRVGIDVPRPPDGDLIAWFRQGHADLVSVLEAAPAGLACWSFLPAPSPLAFWARRQAHETAIHRVDAESATGEITRFDAGIAADGIEEMLFGFASRRKAGFDAEPPRSLHLHATDIDGEWLAVIGRDGLVASREHRKADCAVRGAASDLHLLLWNRRGTEGMEVFGDASLLEFWKEKVQIRWS